MVQELRAVFALACSLALGPLISTSHHATTKTYGNVQATLNWTDELRWQNGDHGSRFKATLMGPASMRITAPGVMQELSLAPFMPAELAWAPVDGPSDGCGAATNLAIVPKAGSPLPYVVAFVVLAEKGCLPVPIVFVPLRAGDAYAYVGAPYFTIWSSLPKAISRIRVASIDRISLPLGSGSGVLGGNVIVVTNALSTGPRVAVFDPPDKPKQIRPGSTIMLGTSYYTWFAPQ
jgi:hypothetical protein